MPRIFKSGLHYYFHGGIFLIAILAFAAGTANAVPADPAPFDLVQPNGLEFAARQIGDERAAWIETMNGYTVTQNKDGWWTYARNPSTASSEAASEFTLLSTGYRVGDVDPHQAGIPKHVRPAYVSSKVDSPLSKLATSVMPTSVTFKSLPSPVPDYLPVTGIRNALVILINFTETTQDSSHTSSYYDDLIFSQSPTANSMYKYYREVSYNALNVTGVVSPTWCHSIHNLSYYGADSSSTSIDDKNENIFELAREAVQLADPYIDFSQYDNDGDGVVDHVMIVHAGAGQESSGISTDIWSHKWSIYNYYPDSGWESDGEEVDGVRVIDYTMLAEGSPLGTFAHEFGHDLGLPDLYNTNPDTGGTVVGSWCLMDSGSWNNGGNTPSHLSAWCKIDLGWITTTVVDSPQSYLVDQVETNPEAFKVITPVLEYQNEYFLVENREKVGFDSYIPESGILIWHIDNWIINEYRNSNEMNAYSIKGVVPEMPDGTLNHAAYSANDGQTVFNTTTTPNSNTNLEYISNVSIDNIGYEGSSIRVDFFGGEHVPPVFSNEYPVNTSIINDQTPLIGINVTDAGIGVNISTVIMNVNGVDVNSVFTPFIDGYHIENATSQPFADGQVVSVSVSASDHVSNTMMCNWSFTVDASAPILANALAYPDSIGTSGIDMTTLSVNAMDISGISSVTIDLSTIGGVTDAVMIDNNGMFSIVTNAGGADVGTHYLSLNATDNVGNCNTSVNIILEVIDDIPPIIAINTPLNGSSVMTSSVNVTGTAYDNIGLTDFNVNGNSVDVDNGLFNTTVSLTNGMNTIIVVATDAAGNTATETVIVMADIHPSLVFAITPTSRVAQVGVPVTLFMSMINGGTANATNVTIAQASSLPAAISYQVWDGATLTGTPDTPVDMAVGEIVHIVLTVNATAEFASSAMTFNVSSTNGATAPVNGVNILTMAASTTPYADVIMMSTSLDVSTAVNTATAFAMATTNVGTASATDVNLVVDIPSSITGLVYQVNETNLDGSIKGPATGLTIPINGNPTFAVFLTPTQAIDYDPANNRIVLKLVDGSGKVVGAQSVAVSTT